MAAFAERLKEAMELKGLKQADVIRLAQPFGEPVGIRIGQEPYESICKWQDRAKAV